MFVFSLYRCTNRDLSIAKVCFVGYTVSHVFVWRLNDLFTFFFIYDIHTEFGILTASCLILIGQGINVSFTIHIQKNRIKKQTKSCQYFKIIQNPENQEL